MDTQTDNKDLQSHGNQHGCYSASRGKWVFIGFAAIAVFLLFTEHRAHVLGVLPWLFLAACPLMHMFHHGGHGHHHGSNTEDESKGENK